MKSSSHTRVFIDSLAVQAHVGYCDWERQRPTTLLVSVELLTPRTRWADQDKAYRLDNLLDYMRVHDYLAGWAARPHTESLEQLCEELLDFCFTDPRIGSASARIVKPHIMPQAAGAGVEISRIREDHEKGEAPVAKPGARQA